MLNIFQINYIQVSMKKNKKNHSYISDENKKYACDSHAHTINLFNKFFESVLSVSGMSTVWEDTYGCAKQYRCALDIYLMRVF